MRDRKFDIMSHLDYLWRLFGTGFSFFIFGLVGLLAGIFIFPALFVVIRNAETRQFKARQLISKMFRTFIWLMQSLGVLSYEVTGTEHIASSGNRLIIANHPTLIDVVFLLALFPQADCVVKEAVVRNPFMRGAVLAANYISNNNVQEFLTKCVVSLQTGSSLLLFPEGTRTVQDKAMTLKPGAAAVAVRSGVDVLPITIKCSPPTLAKGVPWYQIPERRMHFTIAILAPQSVETLTLNEQNQRRATGILNQAFLTFIDPDTP